MHKARRATLNLWKKCIFTVIKLRLLGTKVHLSTATPTCMIHYRPHHREIKCLPIPFVSCGFVRHTVRFGWKRTNSKAGLVATDWKVHLLHIIKHRLQVFISTKSNYLLFQIGMPTNFQVKAIENTSSLPMGLLTDPPQPRVIMQYTYWPQVPKIRQETTKEIPNKQTNNQTNGQKIQIIVW